MWHDALLIPPETLYFLLHPIQRFQADKKRLTLARWHYSRVDVIKICGNEVSFASSAQCVFIFPYLLLSDSCDHRWVACSVANNFDNDWRHRAKCVKPFLACRRHRVGHIANFWDLNKAAAISVCLQEVCDLWETHRHPGWRLYHHLGCFTYPGKHLAYLCTPLFCTSGLHSAERRTTDVTTVCTVEPAWCTALSPPPFPLQCTE